MESELPNNYANALFDLAKPEEFEDYLSAWEVFFTSLQDPNWKKFLASYSIPKEDKYRSIDVLYSFRKAPHFASFVKVVVSHNRVNLLPQIGDAFRSLVFASQGIKEGILLSASPLSEIDVAKIEVAISEKMGTKVVLRQKVDHTLLGGVKVNVEGKVYDGTLRARLQELHRSLKGGSR